jgi:carbonic anhydrase
MDKGALSPNDLTILKTQLWYRDFKEYQGKYPDRTRVEISAAILLYYFTFARTGEVHESQLVESVLVNRETWRVLKLFR